jgi:pantoate--beta-alanine ligase
MTFQPRRPPQPSRAAPTIATTRAALAKARPALSGSCALVPTMGALHEGHRSLLRVAREVADNVVVSIFVNPLQFGSGEDLERYPRSLARDLQMCEEEGVALAFVPTREQMYPTEPVVTVSGGTLATRLEGVSRPGHFDGVLLVVLKLFGLVRPDVAVFGRKDAQQLALIRRLVADLDIAVEVIGAPTVREPDGLALSSRNAFLTPPQRSAARSLPAGLSAGVSRASAGGRRAEILDAVRAVLDAAEGVETDYVALVGADDFVDLRDTNTGAALLLVAARVGTVRLIDNMDLLFDPAHSATTGTGRNS